MKSKVFLNLKGGLGNQIFEIIAAINYCKLNGLDTLNVYVCNLNKYGVKRDFKLHSLLDKLDFSVHIIDREKFWFNYKILNALRFVNNRLFSLVNEDNYFYKIESKSVFLDGYFQSVNFMYVVNGFNLVKEGFQRSYLMNSGLNQIFIENTLSTEFGLHIRGTDFLNDPNYVVSSPFDLLNDLKLNKIWIFTDDRAYSNSLLGKLNIELKFIQDFNLSDFEEFILISMFNYFIISNSTYSLTAVLLGMSNEKSIWAPQKWVNSITDNDNLCKIISNSNFKLY